MQLRGRKRVVGQFDMRRFVDAAVDTNRPGFQPLGCGSILPQGFALGWYRSAPLALEGHPPGVDFWEASQLRLFLKLTHCQKR